MEKYRILIVEDELISANYIKKVLRKYGHHVMGIARSETEMLNHLSSEKSPELVLMDINILGERDGITAAKTLILRSPTTAIIYLTAYHDKNTLARANKTNPIGYLAKPIQPQSLLSTISIGMSNFIERSTSNKIELSENASYDIPSRSIINKGESTLLSEYEALLLVSLLKGGDQFISYYELESNIWADKPHRESALRTTLWRLKKKLPDEIRIENLYGSGYKIRL